MKSPKHFRKTAEFTAVNIFLPAAIVFAALVPMYQSRVESAQRMAELERDVVVATKQIQEVSEADPEADTAAELIGLNRHSILEAEAAKKGVTNRQFELQSGYCTRFARQVVEFNHGKKYAAYFTVDAVKTANRFLNSPYGYHWPAEKSKLGNVIQPGDLLFKRWGSGGYGHVGVYVGDVPGIGKQLVAENATATSGRVQGAKGYRTLERYGAFDVLVRLPLPASYKAATPKAATPRLIVALSTGGKLNYLPISGATLSDGRWRANSAALLVAVGQTARTSQSVTVVDFLKANNAYPYLIGQHLGDKKDPRTYLFIDSK